MKPFYGIDLGTTNSVICTLDDANQPYVYPIGRQDTYTVPSVVWYPQGQKPVVGHLAKNYLPAHPELCVQYVKREMGSETFHRIINGDDKTPQKVSADILRYLVDKANAVRRDNGEQDVNDVVVSVPAKFGLIERQHTIEAVRDAGLNLIALVHEPTAAALSFGIKKEDNKTFIVYDLGGGTFDINIMRVSGNKLKTLAKGGDLKCGGIDWDRAIVEMGLAGTGDHRALEIIQDRLNLVPEFLSTDEGQAMLSKAEEIKISICDPNCHFDLDYIFQFNGKTHTVRIRKDQFIRNTSGLVSKTIDTMENTIREAGIAMDNLSNEVDEIIMVGGGAYMPQIESAIRTRFNVKNIHRQEPGLAIAKGAAIFAGLRDKSWANTLAESGEMDRPATPMAEPQTQTRVQPAPNPVPNPVSVQAPVERTAPAPTPQTRRAPAPQQNDRVVTMEEQVEIEEIGGHSYGIAFQNGPYFSIRNVILKTDELVVNKEFNRQFKTTKQAKNRLTIDVRENDSAELIVREAKRYRCITPNTVMILPENTPVGTYVDIKMSRDINGIITLSASCQGRTIRISIKS